MKQYQHKNRTATWNLWEETVKMASGKEVLVQYFLPDWKKPRNKAKPGTKIAPDHEIHEIGERKTPVVSKTAKAKEKDLLRNFISKAKI